MKISSGESRHIPTNKMDRVVRFTWNMLYDCNYRCSYCFFDGKWEEYKKRNIYLSPAVWLQHWMRIYDKFGPPYIIVTGGEPFIYPDFIELIKKLSSLSYHINISSNSSGDLPRFVKEIDYTKVSLSLSFQPEFDRLENFMERVLFIRRYKFAGCINLVAYPPFLKELDFYKAQFASIGESLKIIPFFGEYQEKSYPEEYTPEQRQLIGIDAAWFKGVRKRGSLCPAGQSTVLVFPDGKVARCGQIGEDMVLGNFFDANFKLLENPLPCQAKYCPCDEGVIPETSEKPYYTQISTDKNHKINTDAHRQNLCSSVSFNLCPSAKNRLFKKYLSEDKNDNLQVATEQKTEDRDIYFTWDIHYKCNFRCPYCWFYTGWPEAAKQNIYLSPEAWLVHWERIYKKYGGVRIEITGGEPFIYPNFIELVKLLSGIHTLKVTTNVSGDVEAFAQEIDPAKVSLDFNFHPLFIDLDTFIKKVLVLKKAGFKGGVCYLAYPPQMGQMDVVRKRIEEAGINFALAAFWGEYNGKKYPQSYTEEEREFMRPFLGDHNRITYHLKAESPRGKLCHAGYKYAGIHANGDVVRCGPLANKLLGNIMDEDFKLLDKPAPCEADSCPCNEYVNLTGD